MYLIKKLLFIFRLITLRTYTKKDRYFFVFIMLNDFITTFANDGSHSALNLPKGNYVILIIYSVTLIMSINFCSIEKRSPNYEIRRPFCFMRFFLSISMVTFISIVVHQFVLLEVYFGKRSITVLLLPRSGS